MHGRHAFASPKSSYDIKRSTETQEAIRSSLDQNRWCHVRGDLGGIRSVHQWCIYIILHQYDIADLSIPAIPSIPYFTILLSSGSFCAIGPPHSNKRNNSPESDDRHDIMGRVSSLWYVAFETKEYSRYGSDAQAEIKGITLPFSYGLMLRRQGRRRAAHRQHSRNKLLDWGVAQVCLYYQLAIFVNLLDLHSYSTSMGLYSSRSFQHVYC